MKSLLSSESSSVPEISCSKKAWQYMGSPMDSSHCDTSCGDHCRTTSTRQLLFLAAAAETDAAVAEVRGSTAELAVASAAAEAVVEFE